MLRRLVAAAIAIIALAVASGVGESHAADPTIAAAGDIACQGGSTSTKCHQMATSDILVKTRPDAVLPLGDDQYERGELWAFNSYYSPSWGRVKSSTYPVPGNHEYLTAGAGGYFDYFRSAAGIRSKGYYSFDVGAWHLVALNSEIDHSGTSVQVAWLKKDLARHGTLCTLAYWHKPRWSSGVHGNDSSTGAFWNVLYAYHVDVVLNGHDHDYERFALQNPRGVPDSPRGIREFVVGTGGRSLTIWGTIKANSQVRNNSTFGVLQLTLHSASYDWKFLPEAGKTWTDSGSGGCR